MTFRVTVLCANTKDKCKLVRDLMCENEYHDIDGTTKYNGFDHKAYKKFESWDDAYTDVLELKKKAKGKILNIAVATK